MNFFEILGTAFGGGTLLYYCHHQVRLLASQDPWGRGEGQGEVICSRGLMFSLVRETWPCLTAGKAILSFGSSEGDLSSRGWSTNSLVTDWLTYSVMVFGNILQVITASSQSKSLSGLIGINCILCKMSFRYDGSRRVVFKHDASKCFIQNMTFKCPSWH